MAALTCGQADHSSADDLLAAVYCRRARGADGPIEAGVALATAARPEAETVFLCIGSLRGDRPDLPRTGSSSGSQGRDGMHTAVIISPPPRCRCDAFVQHVRCDAPRYAAGNFYVNDKPTGSVVGQDLFGSICAWGINDKAGAVWNLIRFASPRATKRNHPPVRDYRYPHTGAVAPRSVRTVTPRPVRLN
jgi:hypothetical protein